MNLLLKYIYLGVIFVSGKIYSQQFYVNSIVNVNNNKVYKLDVSNSTQIEETFCLPTNGYPNETYNDIAIDASGNLYYVSTTGLLYRKNSNNSTCEFLGDFTPGNASIKALTSDNMRFLYATGSPNKFYKYDISLGVFTDMGSLPLGQFSAGDLFFYNSRLFTSTMTGILEINMLDPSQSCPFMSSGTSNIYATFSINYGSYSKAYVILSGSASSALHELDMTNQQIGPLIRTYNHMVNGAASLYDLTAKGATCTNSLSVQENITTQHFFNVTNPVKNYIILKTDIKAQEMVHLRLFDSSGKVIKDFSNQKNIESLDISGILPGNYLLTLSTKNGETYTKKIIIIS